MHDNFEKLFKKFDEFGQHTNKHHLETHNHLQKLNRKVGDLSDASIVHSKKLNDLYQSTNN